MEAVFDNVGLVQSILGFVVSEDCLRNFLSLDMGWRDIPKEEHGEDARYLLASLFLVSKHFHHDFLKALRSVDFKLVWGYGCGTLLNCQVLQWARRYNLKVVHLEAHVDDSNFRQTLEAFTDVKIWNNLTSLELCVKNAPPESALTNQSADLYSLFARATRLKKLGLTVNCDNPYDAYRSLLTLNTLKFVSIHCPDITDALSDIEQLPKLETLEICDYDNMRPRVPFDPFVLNSNTLKVLDFKQSSGWKPLLRLHCPSLEQLIFQHPYFSTIGGSPTEPMLARAPAVEEEGLWRGIVKREFFPKPLSILTLPLVGVTLCQPEAIRVGPKCHIVALVYEWEDWSDEED